MIPAEQFQLFLIRNSTIAQPYKSTVKKRFFFFCQAATSSGYTNYHDKEGIQAK